ncbi:MAG: DNA gyrase subunit A [Acidimicrobiia bacterium]|nr:DNA gyrase subunit A [Acidimicrobiia bacterium]
MPDDQATIGQINIREEMSTSFLDYAMSVIVSRALPDVRDGLKPVHRRILYSMEENGIRAGSPFKKCAQVVGDVMGKYHPHGDSAIYDALVRLGQDFSSRYPLIEPQGNFGTVDDPPAAYRYTECRLENLASHMLEGISENTVDFKENYSGEYSEPEVLPARFPNLLVNGSTGIAVGMATNIPPHNLGEVVDACIHTLDNPDATTEELMEFVKGPDFPTGGYIVGTQGVRDALMTGRGSVKIRAVTDVDEVRKGRTGIIVTEIPYQTGHDRIMTKIAELVHAKRIEGIADLRDESSSRVGTRLVIELKRDARPQVVLNQLYKLTPLQDTFGVNFVALVDGIPRTLSLAEAIKHYLDHQMEVVERRTQFRLDKAEARSHIVEGLLIAVDNIDEVVKLIRGSADVESARAALIERFELTEIQANHILDMPLRRLTALESDKLRAEFADLQKTIKALEAILKSPAKRRKLIAKELEAIREKYADHRRTRIVPDEGEFSMEDLIADEELVVTVTQAGYVKSVVANTYRAQGRGGRGVQGTKLAEDDVISRVLHTTAHAYLLFFTNRGKVHRIRAHEIPRKNRTAKGTLAQAFMAIEPDEHIEAVVDTRDYETSQYLVIATRNGQVKKTKFAEYDSRQASLIAIKLADDDEVVSVRTTSGDADILLFTHKGQGIRFAESDIRSMGRSTQGVRGIKLRDGDFVVSAAQDGEGDEVLLLTTAGYGKRTKMDQFPKQKRGGLGVKAIKITPSRGTLISARAVSPGSQVFVTSSDGIVMRTGVDSISRQKRDASGVKVMNLEDGATLTAFTLVPAEET